jgi:hypothetical protein
MAYLQVLNSPVKQGDTVDGLKFSFSGFYGHAPVWIGVVGGGGITVHSNADGTGSGAMIVGEPPGTYTLRADDGGYGHTAYATFSIVADNITYNPKLYVDNSPVTQGDTVNGCKFHFTGFKPNTSVWVGLSGGGGINVLSDGSGNGSGAMILGEPPGTYTLKATDTAGNQATCTFSIVAQQPTTPWSELISSNINLFIKGVKVLIGKAGDPATMQLDYTAAVHNVRIDVFWKVTLRVLKGTTVLVSKDEIHPLAPWTDDDESTSTISADFTLPQAGTASTVTLTAQVLIQGELKATKTFVVTYSSGADPSPGQQEGTLKVNSTPTGAQVYVNNSLVGVTPLTKVLGVGNWMVHVKKEGYEDYQQIVTITEGVTVTVTAELEEVIIPVTGGKINIESTPSEAAVYNGASLCGTTPLNLTVPEGTHTITLKKTGYKNTSKTFSIEDGDVKSWNATLTPTSGGGGDDPGTKDNTLYLAIGIGAVAVIAFIALFRH